MRRDRVNYFIIGVFVLAAGAALLLLLYRLTGTTGPTDRYHAYYENVAGIKYGTVTYYKGFQVGQVESVSPEQRDHKTRYRVEFSVTRGWKIPSGSMAAIVLPGPLASAVIDVREGEGPDLLEPGFELKGQEQPSIFEALNDVRPVLKNINERITALSMEYEDLSMTQVRPLVTSLQQHLGDPKLYDEFKQTIKKLDASAEALTKVLSKENQQHLSSILSNAERGSAQLNEVLSRIDLTREQAHHLTEELDKLVTDNRSGVTQTIQDASAAMRDLRDSIRIVADNIETIVHYLEGSSQNMQEFTHELRANPGILFSGKPPQDPLPTKVKEN